MARKDEIKKLEGARDTIASVYLSQATDDISDNGNLTSLNNALLVLNESIKKIKALG